MSDLLGNGYTLTVNNWYTSPALFEKLYDEKTHACGTVRADRKGLPEDPYVNHDGTPLLKGQVTHRSSEKLLFLCWRDKNYVKMLSNYHDETIVDTRKRKHDGSLIRKAQVINDYNSQMGGVDKADQMIQYYSCHRKTKKWYKKLSMHLIDIAVYNAFVCWVKSQHNPNQSLKNKHLQFRLRLISQMVSDVGVDPSALFTGGRPRSVTVAPQRLTARHFPTLNPGSGKRAVSFRVCRICSPTSGHRHEAGGDRRRKETKYMCAACGNVPLCAAPCFAEWHTKQNIN